MSQCTAEINNERCQRDLDSDGYCQMHRRQVSRKGRITNIQPRQPKPVKPKVAKVKFTRCTAVLGGESCQREHFANGYCSMHDSQMKQHGRITNLLPTPSRAQAHLPAPQRFESRLKPGGDDMNCWEWIGSKKDDGYTRFWDKGKPHYAHRWAWEYLIGVIPAGMELDHICRNVACVRPSHLQIITRAAHAKVSQQQRDMLNANEDQVMVGGNPKARSIQEINFALRHGLPGYLNGAKVIQR